MSTIVPDDVRFTRPVHVPGLELVRAAYSDRRFPVHIHPQYVVGVIEAGAESLCIRGRELIAGAGSALFIEPEEAHSNATIAEARLIYSVFYIDAALFAEALGRPTFTHPVQADSASARTIAMLHHALAAGGDRFEQQSAFTALIDVVEHHANGARITCGRTQTAANLIRAKDYLTECFHRNPDLDEIANAAGLGAFQLLRQFKRRYGLSPVAYRNQLRVHEACRLLRAGWTIADAADRAGFADQSHLTRQFQRLIGVSPARYAQQ